MFCVNLIIILLYTLSILGDTEMSNTMFLLLISSQKKMYGLSLEGLTIAFKFLYNVNLEHVIKKRICFTLTAVSANRLMFFFFFFFCVSLLREVHHTYLLSQRSMCLTSAYLHVRLTSSGQIPSKALSSVNE